jgi:flagellum-specific peptidoglycan hydrolase FlgJ
MKKMMLIILLILSSFSLQAPKVYQDEKAIYQQWQDLKFVENIRNTEFSADNLHRLIDILCKNPDIVFAQAKLESRDFKSKLFLDYNNIFGMKKPSVRPTTATGWAMGHAAYSHWSESVEDMVLYQQYYETILGIDFNYIDYMYFLKMYGYAQDKYYVKKLSIILQNDSKDNR